MKPFNQASGRPNVIVTVVISLNFMVAGCDTQTPTATAHAPEEETAASPVEQITTKAAAISRLTYPVTRKGTVTDDYHGTNVADPYRWLEDDVRESEEVSEWVESQNALSGDYLKSLPNRVAINKRMTRLWNYERSSTLKRHGERYWYTYNNGLANQSQVFATEDPMKKGDLILDPNSWSQDGTVALSGYWPSPDGKNVAYTIADGGTDWRIAKVHNLSRDSETTDELRWLKFTSLSWNGSGSGFYYSRYPEPAEGEEFQSTNLNKAVYFHTLGEAQDKDRLVFANSEHPERGFWTQVTDDGKYLVITSSIGTDDRYEVFVQEIDEPGKPTQQLVQGFEYDYALIGNLGSRLLFRSNEGAPKGKVIAFNLLSEEAEAELVIRETANTLESGSLVNNTLVLNYLQDAASRVQLVVFKQHRHKYHLLYLLKHQPASHRLRT